MSRRWLIAFRIAGNHAIASDALESALALHEAIGDGAAIDPYLLGLDTDRIRAAYLRRGFFAMTVTPTVEQRGARQVVTFTIAEGRRAVSRVEIAGLPPEVGTVVAVRARAGQIFGDVPVTAFGDFAWHIGVGEAY